MAQAVVAAAAAALEATGAGTFGLSTHPDDAPPTRNRRAQVGKKLPRAQNDTDTSFKSRAISLGEQSLAADRAGQAVSGRNLTLKELLGQVGACRGGGSVGVLLAAHNWQACLR